MYKIIGADGQAYGPVNAEQIKQWIVEGRARSETLVQAEGATEWKPLTAFAIAAKSFSALLRSLVGRLPGLQN